MLCNWCRTCISAKEKAEVLKYKIYHSSCLTSYIGSFKGQDDHDPMKTQYNMGIGDIENKEQPSSFPQDHLPAGSS